MRKSAKAIVKQYFKNDYGEPFEITDTQADIFLCIVTRKWLRVEVICPTQFGKSSTIAMALIIASTNDHEDFAIVTGSESKSQIIMEKVVQHTFDHPKFTALLELDDNEPLDRIRRQRSRKMLTWKGGGSVRTITADARNRQRVKETLTGLGCILAGEKVITEIGEVDIKDLCENKLANFILSYNHDAEEYEFKKINDYQINERIGRDMLKLEAGGKSFIATSDHPVYVHGKGYIPLSEVVVCDEVNTVETKTTVESITKISTEDDVVYNLEVEGNNNYYVGGVLVHNSKNIVEDEASLIPDDIQAMIMRMLGGYRDGFLLKIGNPFYRNHFMRTWNSDKYQHIFADYMTALAEGRYTEQFIDEMRSEAFFDVLYECKFPDDNEVNEQGWRRLVLDAELQAAFDNADIEVNRPKGKPRLGVDVAAGGNNYTAFVLRYDNYMTLLEKNRDPDLMSQVAKVVSYMQQYGIEGYNIGIDDVGVGHGVTDRLKEKGIYVNAVKEGASAIENDKYINLRAENYWLLGQWIKSGGKIIKNDDFFQIDKINYKEDSSSRLKIEPKAELAKRGIPSPDVADAATLTFSNAVVVTSSDFDIL